LAADPVGCALVPDLEPNFLVAAFIAHIEKHLTLGCEESQAADHDSPKDLHKQCLYVHA
jgi:hypothetical protein